MICTVSNNINVKITIMLYVVAHFAEVQFISDMLYFMRLFIETAIYKHDL